ncbi:MAG: hypothetical protein ACJASQ_002578 [Crocinitomicaceae bacterium]|jgi:hypothetical protein
MKNSCFISILILLFALTSCGPKAKQNQSLPKFEFVSVDLSYPLEIKKYDLVYRSYEYDYSRRKVTYSDRHVDSILVNLLSDSSMTFQTSYRIDHSVPYLVGRVRRMSDTITWKNDSLPQHNIFFNGGDVLFEKDSSDLIVFRSSWSCSPWCEHGHISYNSSIFYSLKYGVLCNFDRKRKSHVEVLYSVKGEPVKKEVVLKILKQFEIEESIISTFSNDEL